MSHLALGVARDGTEAEAAAAPQVLEAAGALEARSPDHKGERQKGLVCRRGCGHDAVMMMMMMMMMMMVAWKRRRTRPLAWQPEDGRSARKEKKRRCRVCLWLVICNARRVVGLVNA